MALSEKDKKRIQTILNAEWANFQNFAITYNLLQKRKKWALAQLALYNAKKPSAFKKYADYSAFVVKHNKMNAQWLKLKNAYTERQRQLRALNSPYLKEGFDSFTKNSIKLVNEADNLNGLGVIPLLIVLICVAIGSLSTIAINKLFGHESSVLQDYKELTTLTQEVSKTDPQLAKEILQNYQGVAFEQIKKETDSTVSAQVGKGLQTAIVVGGIGLTALGIYKFYQSNSRKNRRR